MIASQWCAHVHLHASILVHGYFAHHVFLVCQEVLPPLPPCMCLITDKALQLDPDTERIVLAYAAVIAAPSLVMASRYWGFRVATCQAEKAQESFNQLLTKLRKTFKSYHNLYPKRFSLMSICKTQTQCRWPTLPPTRVRFAFHKAAVRFWIAIQKFLLLRGFIHAPMVDNRAHEDAKT